SPLRARPAADPGGSRPHDPAARRAARKMIGFCRPSFPVSHTAVHLSKRGSAGQNSHSLQSALAGLGPAIHDSKPLRFWEEKTWMLGPSPGKAILRWWAQVRILPAAIAVGILLIVAPAYAVRP